MICNTLFLIITGQFGEAVILDCQVPGFTNTEPFVLLFDKSELIFQKRFNEYAHQQEFSKYGDNTKQGTDAKS